MAQGKQACSLFFRQRAAEREPFHLKSALHFESGFFDPLNTRNDLIMARHISSWSSCLEESERHQWVPPVQVNFSPRQESRAQLHRFRLQAMTSFSTQSSCLLPCSLDLDAYPFGRLPVRTLINSDTPRRCPTDADEGYVCYDPNADFQCLFGPPITACANGEETESDSIQVKGRS